MTALSPSPASIAVDPSGRCDKPQETAKLKRFLLDNRVPLESTSIVPDRRIEPLAKQIQEPFLRFRLKAVPVVVSKAYGFLQFHLNVSRPVFRFGEVESRVFAPNKGRVPAGPPERESDRIDRNDSSLSALNIRNGGSWTRTHVSFPVSVRGFMVSRNWVCLNSTSNIERFLVVMVCGSLAEKTKFAGVCLAQPRTVPCSGSL